MTDLDRLRKLLALAVHPTTPAEEARTAAMQACKIIDEEEVSIAGEAVTAPKRKWAAPDPDVEDILSKLAREQRNSNAAEKGGGLKAHITDSDIDDEFMRKRITLAWQRIRDERKKLEIEINRLNAETGWRYPQPDWRG